MGDHSNNMARISFQRLRGEIGSSVGDIVDT